MIGNVSGSRDCWGTWGKNEVKGGSNSQVDNFIIGESCYQEIGKYYVGGDQSGVAVNVDESNGSSGTWSFDSNGYDSFLTALKTGSDPGFAIWLFDGPDAQSTFGEWSVAWGKDLSHISVYATEISQVQLPASIVFLMTGVAGIAFLRRRKLIKS
ncbi:MAG: hypothetical protein ACI9Y1_001900 [Lentisphaeria bacterium]